MSDPITEAIEYIVKGGDPNDPEDARDLKTNQGKKKALVKFAKDLKRETPKVFEIYAQKFEDEIRKLSGKLGKYLSVHDLLAADTAKIKNWKGDEGEEQDDGEDEVVLTPEAGRKLAGVTGVKGGKKKRKRKKRRKTKRRRKTKHRRKTKRRRKRRKTRRKRR